MAPTATQNACKGLLAAAPTPSPTQPYPGCKRVQWDQSSPMHPLTRWVPYSCTHRHPAGQGLHPGQNGFSGCILGAIGCILGAFGSKVPILTLGAHQPGCTAPQGCLPHVTLLFTWQWVWVHPGCLPRIRGCRGPQSTHRDPFQARNRPSASKKSLASQLVVRTFHCLGCCVPLEGPGAALMSGI